jgi:galactoside O-acetyltransferase
MNINDESMGENAKKKLKEYGAGVVIYPLAKIVNPQAVEIGDYTRIDDFTFINGGKSTKIGRYVHIASFVSIVGGGELVIGDYVGIAAGCRIITGSDTYYGGKRMSASLPLDQRNVVFSTVRIEKDAFVGTNSVIYPNVTIGEGAIIGSNSLVLNDIEPWSINVGSPCKKIKERPKVIVEDI